METKGLFRAKEVETNEWVFGYYVFCEKKHFIMNGTTKSTGWHEVDINTLGRYCGIDDVDGQKAFEGDIIQRKTYDYNMNLLLIDNYILRYPSNHYGFVLQDVFRYLATKKTTHGYRIPSNINEMKIIGNIIDNPDLPINLNAEGRVHTIK